MDDKTFELMEKMYVEFKQEFNKMDEKFDGINNRLTNLEIKIENDVSDKIKLLFEGHDVIIERLDTVENKLDKISGKLDKNDMRIQLVESGMK